MLTLNAIEIAEIILNHVKYDFSIGSANFKGTEHKMSAKAKTAGWAEFMMGGVRFGFSNYSKCGPTDEHPHQWAPSYRATMKVNWHGYDRFQLLGNVGINYREYKDIEHLVNSAHNKTGNCDEMACLAFLKTAEFLVKHLNKDDEFFIEKLQMSNIDHNVLRIYINGTLAICDPWIGMTFTMPQDLIKFKEAMRTAFSFESKVDLEAHWSENVPLFTNRLPNAGIAQGDSIYHIRTIRTLNRYTSVHTQVKTTLLRQWPCCFDNPSIMREARSAHREAFEPTLAKINKPVPKQK